MPDLEEFRLYTAFEPDKTDIINLAMFEKLNSFHMFQPVLPEEDPSKFKNREVYSFKKKPLVVILVNGAVPVEAMSLQCFYQRDIIESLAKLKTLRVLELSYCFITPDELLYLIQKLERLALLRIQISEKSLLYIKRDICALSGCVPLRLINENQRWLKFSNNAEFLPMLRIEDDD